LKHDKLLRISNWKRTKESCVNQAENGGVRADAQGESENRDRGKAGGFAEHAKGEAEVLKQGVEEGKTAVELRGTEERGHAMEKSAKNINHLSLPSARGRRLPDTDNSSVKASREIHRQEYLDSVGRPARPRQRSWKKADLVRSLPRRAGGMTSLSSVSLIFILFVCAERTMIYSYLSATIGSTRMARRAGM
jgi:hypothetical protein